MKPRTSDAELARPNYPDGEKRNPSELSWSCSGMQRLETGEWSRMARTENGVSESRFVARLKQLETAEKCTNAPSTENGAKSGGTPETQTAKMINHDGPTPETPETPETCFGSATPETPETSLVSGVPGVPVFGAGKNNKNDTML